MKNFYKNKKILVTGGSGMIGSSLVKKLVKLGAKVTVVSLELNRSLPKNIIFKKVDLRNLQNCIKVTKKIDYVFHLAGIKGSPLMAKKLPYKFMSPMIMFNTNIIEAAKINKVKRFMYTSSIGVYEPAPILKEKNVWETFPSKNDWFAGWAKRIGELTIEACKKETGMNMTIVRPANVFGPYDNFDEKTAMVIPSLISKFFNSKNNQVEVWGDGSNLRDFIYSEDVADAMLLVMKKNPNFPVNIGSGNGVRIKKIVTIINSYFGDKYKINWNTNFPGGDKKRIMDISNLKKLGFKRKSLLKKNIHNTIEWFKTNKKFSLQRYNSFNEK
tara:strand:+ start:14929 stop:15912 length:984 start_codon:yes stop_codon:yes gene_type:complete